MAGLVLTRARVRGSARAIEWLSGDRIAAVRQALSSAESASGAAKRAALTKLAAGLDADAAKSSDAAKVRLLAAAVRGVAK